MSSPLAVRQETIDLADARGAQVELRLLRSAQAEGVVVDGAGRPVAGARVRLARRSQSYTGLTVATTGLDGRFAVTLAEHRGSWLRASHDDFAPSQCIDVDAARPRSDLRLVLGAAGASVGGIVRDARGVPLRGARLLVVPRQPDAAHFQFDVAAVSAADGSFHIGGLAAVPSDLCVLARGHGPLLHALAPAPGAHEAVDLRLPDAAAVRGRARGPDGEPIAGAGVGVVAAAVPWLEFETVTGDDGRFVLDGLAPGAVTLVCAAEGLEQRVELSLVEGSALTWDPVLSELSTIRGMVVDDAGRPLAKRWVASHGAGGGMPRNYVQTDAGGRFTLEVRGSAAQTVVVGPPFATPILQVDDVAPGTADLVVRLPDAGRADARVTGIVLDADGAPVDARVRLMRAGFDRAMDPADATDDAGRFEIRGVRAGRWRAVVVVGGALLARSAELDVPPGGTADAGTIRVDPPGSLEVRIAADHAGTVSLWTEDGMRVAEASIAGGAARFPRLAAGPIVAVASAGARRGVAIVELLPGRAALQAIELRDCRQVAVSIAGGERTCLLRARDPLGALLDLRIVAPAEGPAVLELPVGRATIELRSADGRSARAEVDVSADSAAPSLEIALPPAPVAR